MTIYQKEIKSKRKYIYGVYETDEIIERVILVGVAFDTDDDQNALLMSLESLLRQQVRRQ